ncbi:aldose 1-epimerase family protein [Ligilactobacillus ceti]|uniref:Aldose epimerase n=1 Tax=Ligilactobacillus ceti DSM 22408 TaxID=1122146 RepID=A0A0R2KPW0_9LACO|nr:aldose 1-epimerase family protein [Ligilactobacillus ceti]KRN88940.1 aldose epimerase [Ligilactobacillus ceti DSM 22408]
MSLTLTNDVASVTINEFGAELTSFYHKLNNLEYIWSGDAKYWGRHAPVLFPIVGRLKDNTYYLDDQSYNMSQHGFARDLPFEITYQSATKATFTLYSSEKTKEKYPYNFKLSIHYQLIENNLKITYEINNPNPIPLPFAIGAHPAFKVPLKADEERSDYYLSLSPTKARTFLPLKNGLLDLENKSLHNAKKIHLNPETFKNDALIFDLQADETNICLKSRNHPYGVSLTTTDARFIGLWSNYPNSGQFVCIEPWWGITDTVNTTQQLSDKYGINILAPFDTFTTMYTISIY